MTDHVLCLTMDGVATLSLNNPPLNLITRDLTRSLEETLVRLAGDPEVRALVVTGAGERAFCAGSDIAEFEAVAADVVAHKLWRENAAYTQLARFPKPTVAALRGLAFGGGLELAVCCDLIVAEAAARLALPEVKLGVFPGSGGTVRVTRRIVIGRAKEFMLLGEPIDAETALAWGLVNRVVGQGDALIEAEHLARSLAERPARALAIIKEAIDMALDLPEAEAVHRSLALSEQVFATEDCREGARAFREKRVPHFKHR